MLKQFITPSQARDQAFRKLRRALRLGRRTDMVPAAQELKYAIESQYRSRRPDEDDERRHVREAQIRRVTEWEVLTAAEEANLDSERGHEIAGLIMTAVCPAFAAPPDVMAEFADDLAAYVPGSPEPKTIRIDPGTLTEQVDAAERALIAGGLNIYQRAGAVVRLGWVEAGEGESLRVVPVDDPHLLELIGRVTRWLKRDARSRGYVLTSCPREVAQAYLARGGLEWRLPHLTGVIEATTLRGDGSVLDAPGHDPETGLYLAKQCSAMPSFTSRDAAWDAVEDLGDLLDEFPFIDTQDYAVALAAILTATIRRSLPTAPLFAFTAPAPGSGKSMLADLVAMIATGSPAKSMTWTGDPAEDRKALDSALLEGAPIISLDNVTAPLGGDRLNQMLTQGHATVRVLGQSRNVETRCGALVMANGNSLAIAADTTRRTMLCRLDPDCERPELRTFRADPLERVRQDRARYLRAALTILEAYNKAGRPGRPKPLGSFSEWSDWVRGAVMWLVAADPAASQEAAREVDPRGAELAAVLGQWNECIGDRRVTAAQIIEAAVQHTEFREALLGVAGTGGSINSYRLGNWLRANKDRLVGGLAVKPAGRAKGGVTAWLLQGGRASSGVVARQGREFLEDMLPDERVREDLRT